LEISENEGMIVTMMVKMRILGDWRKKTRKRKALALGLVVGLITRWGTEGLLAPALEQIGVEAEKGIKNGRDLDWVC
jgi:hypothetical protein